MVLLAGLLGYPIGRLLIEAFADGPAELADTVFRDVVGTAAFSSVWTSAVAASLALGLGTALALLTERSDVRGGRLMRAGVVATLVVPPFVSAISWQATYAPFGLLDDLTGLSAPWLEGWAGVVVVIAVNVAPLAYLVVAAALRSSRIADLEWSARASGAGAGLTLRLITLPLVRPALAAGWLVGFAASLASFGVPVVLGTRAGVETLTTRVYRAVAFSAQPAAFREAVVMALLLALIALVAVMLTDRRYAAASDTVLGGPTSEGSRRLRTPRGAAVAAWGYLVVTTGLPFAGLVLRAITRAVGVSATPANWTLANFRQALDDRFWEALGRSAVLALGAALLAIVAAGLFVLVQRAAGRGWGAATLVMFAIPGTSIALAVSLGYGRWLANTAAIILVAYVAKLVALAHRPLAASVAGIHPDLIRAGRASGASARRVLQKLIAPLLRPALVAGGLLVFVFAIHELTMSSILHGPGNETLAVVVLDYQQIGDPTVTAALATVLALIVGTAALPFLWLRRSWEGRR